MNLTPQQLSSIEIRVCQTHVNIQHDTDIYDYNQLLYFYQINTSGDMFGIVSGVHVSKPHPTKWDRLYE